MKNFKQKLNSNYVQFDKNSHFYTDLEMIKHSLELGLDRKYIIGGIQNTIARGYHIIQRFDSE